MPRLIRQPAVPWLLVGVFVATGCFACNRDQGGNANFRNRGPQQVAEDLVEIPDGTSAEMLKLAKKSLTKSRQLAKAKSSSRRDKQREKQLRDEFRLATLTGVRAADRVLADPAAQQDQALQARKAKLLLLYAGVKSDGLKFAPRFHDYAAQLAEQHAGSDEAVFAAAAGLELECGAKNTAKNDMLAKLVKHAQAHPEHDASVKLFDVFARQLESRDDERGAEQCYRLGIKTYADHPRVDLLKEGLSRLEQTKIQRVARRAALDVEERDIRRRLGYPNGSFVIYAEENVTPPRGSMMYFYHYEYEVLNGVESAVAYVKNLPETYSWRLERRYPDTSEGRRQAYELWKTLLKKKKSSS